MTRTVLITGGTGFTGGYLAELYTSLGWHVHITSLHSRWDRADDVAVHPLDLRDASATLGLINLVRPEIVHHLAGQSSVRQSWRDPPGTLLGNTIAQLNVLEAVTHCRPDTRVVVVGSCDEYGSPPVDLNPITEVVPLRPVTPYAASKVTQDLMGLQYAAFKSMDVVRVRPFLQLGPRRSDKFVAGSFARQVAEIRLGTRKPAIEVGSVDLVRDFTDVRDVARALFAVAESGLPGEVYNIASGTGHTLREMLATMISAAGVDTQVREIESLQRPGEPSVMVGSNLRLRSTTGWEPEIPFDQSAVDTYEYWLERIAREKGN